MKATHFTTYSILVSDLRKQARPARDRGFGFRNPCTTENLIALGSFLLQLQDKGTCTDIGSANEALWGVQIKFAADGSIDLSQLATDMFDLHGKLRAANNPSGNCYYCPFEGRVEVVEAICAGCSYPVAVGTALCANCQAEQREDYYYLLQWETDVDGREAECDTNSGGPEYCAPAFIDSDEDPFADD